MVGDEDPDGEYYDEALQGQVEYDENQEAYYINAGYD